MLKKVFLWGLYFGFVALLVIGGINRTLARSETNVPLRIGNANPSLGANSASDLAGGDIEGNSDHEPKPLIVLTGQVETVRQGRVTVIADDNQTVELAGRSWRYAQSLGFTVEVGDALSIEGFDENGIFKIVSLKNISNGQSAQLRDVSGSPLWDK